VRRQSLAEDLLHLAEDAARARRIFDCHGPFQLLQQIALRLRQLRRRRDANLYNEVALAVLVKVRDALAAQPDLLAALRPFGNLDIRRPFEGLNLELCSKSRLRKRDGHHTMKIVAVPLKELVRLDVENDVKVTGGAAEYAGLALALVADAGVLLHAGGNLDQDGVLLLDPGLAPAALAGIADGGTRAAALGAGSASGPRPYTVGT
jgi:hypothetical protein